MKCRLIGAVIVVALAAGCFVQPPGWPDTEQIETDVKRHVFPLVAEADSFSNGGPLSLVDSVGEIPAYSVHVYTPDSVLSGTMRYRCPGRQGQPWTYGEWRVYAVEER